MALQIDKPRDQWDAFCEKIYSFKKLLNRSKSLNVNEKKAKADAIELVQNYFREARPLLKSLGIEESALSSTDSLAQKLLRLSNGNNSRKSYKSLISDLIVQKEQLEIIREKLIGFSREYKPDALHEHEKKILITLQEMVPTSALSYEQGCKDLNDSSRVSFRGVANEFRECIREVLDHLAPDKEVIGQQNFKYEADKKGPTMKQKVRFILKARGQSNTAIETPENSLMVVEETVGKLARSIYERSSISTHVTTTRGEVKQLKLYVESLLSELLEIHK